MFDLIASQFQPFGAEHWTVLGVTVVLSALLPLTVRRFPSERFKRNICVVIALLLVATECFNYYYTIAHDGWDKFVDVALPLHACGFSLYLTAFMLLTRRQAAFEIVYFWGFAGTTQALLTPITQAGFPSWSCFHFFITHGLVIVGVSFATFGLKMRPRFKGVWITYAFSWALVFIVGGCNWLLGTNYMYLCERPSGSTPFYFLPWPWYILFLGLLAIVFFVLLWLPFKKKQ
ncbi:MAG: YwaF family protein [Planctomycetota bacterium]